MRPWLSFGFVEGIGYNTSVSNYEKTYRENFSQLLNYLGFELEAPFQSSCPWWDASTTALEPSAPTTASRRAATPTWWVCDTAGGRTNRLLSAQKCRLHWDVPIPIESRGLHHRPSAKSLKTSPSATRRANHTGPPQMVFLRNHLPKPVNRVCRPGNRNDCAAKRSQLLINASRAFSCNNGLSSNKTREVPTTSATARCCHKIATAV